jgi:tellurite resistance protein TerC
MVEVGPWSEWATFVATVLATMVLDRLLCSRSPDGENFRLAVQRTLLWVVVGAGFAGWVMIERGTETGLNYLTAYLLEESLSIDNLFVFLIIFRHFGVSGEQQRRVLWWGLSGAVVLRAVFIVLGAELLLRIHWTFYLFGAFLVISGLRLAKGSDKSVDPSKSMVLRLAKRFLRTTEEFSGARFFTRVNGVLHATPLFLVLLVVEISDLVFAVDSVPAVLGITVDLYVVYTSNIMAVLGLRALYFLLSGMMGRFHKLDWALSAVLVFVGIKMIGHDLLHVPNLLSLAIIVGLLCLGIGASLVLPRPRNDSSALPPGPEISGKS